MNDFFELVVGATASGCIYGLVALAYLLMTRPTGIINFAVGEWAMMAAFAGVVMLNNWNWPYPVGLAVMVVMMFGVGWLTERLTVRPLVEAGAPPLAPILALLGMLVVFREAISIGFGPDPQQKFAVHIVVVRAQTKRQRREQHRRQPPRPMALHTRPSRASNKPLGRTSKKTISSNKGTPMAKPGGTGA